MCVFGDRGYRDFVHFYNLVVTHNHRIPALRVEAYVAIAKHLKLTHRQRVVYEVNGVVFPSSAEVKNARSDTHTPLMSSWCAQG